MDEAGKESGSDVDDSPVESAEFGIQQCYYHPDVETGLRCSSCGRPICPRDLVQTAVGAKCPDCARPTRGMSRRGNPLLMARALGAGLGSGLIGGLLISEALRLVYSPLIMFLILGLGISEAIRWGSGRIGGILYVGIAVGSTLWAVIVAMLRVGDPTLVIWGLVGAGLAGWRLRD